MTPSHDDGRPETGRPTAADSAATVQEHSAPHFDDEGDVDLSDVRWVDAGAVVVFWVLAGVVFLQFFSRYVLNDSIGWTEEIARYLLIGVAFTGAIIAVRKDSHVFVEFFYRWLPFGARRVLSLGVDAGKVLFFAYATWLSSDLASKTRQKMASIEVSKAVIYWVVAVCFAVMTVYAVSLFWRRLQGEHGPLVAGDAALADETGAK